MNLECQVCSLELSVRLKELGVKQDSLFYWQRLKGAGTDDEPVFVISYIKEKFNSDYFLTYSAFTSAELGQMLTSFDTFKRVDGTFVTRTYEFIGENIHEEADKSEINSRAKMLIYVINKKAKLKAKLKAKHACLMKKNYPNETIN